MAAVAARARSAILGVTLDLLELQVAADALDFVHRAPALGHLGAAPLAHAVRRALPYHLAALARLFRQAGRVAHIAKPMAERGLGERIDNDMSLRPISQPTMACPASWTAAAQRDAS